MGTSSALTLLLFFGVALSACALSDRIVENEIQFPSLQSLKGVPIVDPPKRIAGYFKLDRTKDAHMFYFLFGSRNSASDPVVLWMTGGPGCSSELAVFYENGPYSINRNMTLTETEYGWDRFHTTIFVDQPINTGFSYSDDEKDRVFDEVVVAEDMLDFLQEFFEVHPELADRPFYVTGESYAGHYVPVVSHRIWLANKNKEGRPINLQGIAIGNGLTNPALQFPAYPDYALQNNLINQGVHDSMKFWSPVCTFATSLCNSLGWSWVCGLGLNFCQAITFLPILEANPEINVYDITKLCEGPLCYDFDNANKFLNLASTRKALGVGDIEWEGCNMDVHEDLSGDWLKDYTGLIPDMLEDGIRVMIYAGDLDLICNWLGNYRWVEAMEWSGQAAWQQSPEADWVVQGRRAGSVKAAGPLSFVKVAKAGHMVPMDQPLNALSMITAFTRQHSLASRAELPVEGDGLEPKAAEELHLQQLAEPAAADEGAASVWSNFKQGRGEARHTIKTSLPRELKPMY